MTLSDWLQYHTYILELEKEGKVTRTFRRLDLERQQAILNAVLAEANAKGPASLNIKEIARRAGVSVGSLYQYFPNRDGLLDFTVTLFVRYLTDLFEMSRPFLREMPLREALKAYLQVGVEWGQTEADLIRFFGRAAYQGDHDLGECIVRPIATLMRDIIREMLATAAARGEIRPEVDVEAAARVVNLMMIAMGDSQLLPYLNVYFQVTDESMPLQRVTDGLVEMILRGIEPLEKGES